MKYRQVHMRFWNDSEIIEMTPEEKYFYLYLLTNPYTTQSGIYEISKKVMAFETGYNVETIEKLIAKFESKGKIKFDPQTNEILIKNWLKYNWNNSPKVIGAVVESLKRVKSSTILKIFWQTIPQSIKETLIEYGYGMDTVSIDYPYGMDTISRIKENKIKEKENKIKDISLVDQTDSDESVDSDESTTEESEIDTSSTSESNNRIDKTPYQQIVDLYNRICSSLPNVKMLNNTRRRLIKARWREYPDLTFWEAFFKRVEESNFLTGRVDPVGDRPPFVANFDWLLKSSGFVKILEGYYDNRKTRKELEEEREIEELRKKVFEGS